MRPDERFLKQPRSFWASVRSISQAVGYTVRGEGTIRVPTIGEITAAFAGLGLSTEYLVSRAGKLTKTGRLVIDYFQFRADVLNTYVEPRLMNPDRAKLVFERLHAELSPRCPLPINKQKGAKKAPAFLTAIVNMLVEANSQGCPCNFDPRQLTTITRDGVPLRTLSRRVDGAFPGPVNPIALWEIKEYYYTTTFGSRVADGIYETLLDGMELEELREHEGVDVRHYLVVDSHYTWWQCGKSYLCRIIDMLHMGYLDEALFGYEVVERMPEIVREWLGLRALQRR